MTQLTKVEYLSVLSRLIGDPNDIGLIEHLINEYFSMLNHMRETSLYDVLMYEITFAENNLEPMRILAHENEKLKKEVNELRKQLGKVEKYKEN